MIKTTTAKQTLKLLADKAPTEHQEQRAVIEWWDRTYPLDKADLFAVPNGAWLAGNAAQQMSKLKREGLRDGTPDLELSIANHKYHGLFIEMKKQKGGVLSAIQKRRINQKRRRGYKAVVCEGADVAIEIIKDYMKTECPKIECELLE